MLITVYGRSTLMMMCKCNPFLQGEARDRDKIFHVLKISYSLTRNLRICLVFSARFKKGVVVSCIKVVHKCVIINGNTEVGTILLRAVFIYSLVVW